MISYVTVDCSQATLHCKSWPVFSRGEMIVIALKSNLSHGIFLRVKILSVHVYESGDRPTARMLRQVSVQTMTNLQFRTWNIHLDELTNISLPTIASSP